MRIAYIVTDLGRGGTQGWVEYSALELVKHGHAITVIAEKTPHDRRKRLEEHGVVVHAFEIPPSRTEYRRIIQETGAEVIHLHVWERFSELIRLRELCNVPVALSYHSVPNITWKQWVVRVVKPSLKHWSMYECFSLKEALRYIDAHIGCCNASARGIRNKFWPFMGRRVFSLPNAIPFPEANGESVIGGPPRFLQVGALNERKNPLLTLMAFEMVQKQIPDSTLTFVGGGPQHKELHGHVSERAIRNVFLEGEVQDPSPYYIANNILIQPSRAEGLPYTLIEGAGRGIPLIASNVDGNPEICLDDQNGILLREISVNALQEAMLSLASNREKRISMGNCGRGLVAEKFSMRRFTGQLVQIYETTIERDVCSAK
ncbi:MAG: glycosyltransferase family 1 protein [Desulfuromonadales bacterium]|nr:MAG: glycosyltransferase family 1 protein [Desulfuromonadales bacterium]